MTALVLVVVLGVATFDVVVGLRLLFSSRPWEVNGPGTIWARVGPDAFAREPALLESAFRRLGAFSLHTGVATAVWALTSWDRPAMLLTLLGTYTVTGLFFFHGDRRDFAGTRYFAIKQALGAAWAAALAVQIGLVATG